MFIEISTWIHLFRVGKMDYSATCSLDFSLFLYHSCYVPMGAISPGPFSNGLNITWSHIIQTQSSGEEKIWGMVHREGMTMITPGTTDHGNGSCAGHIS